MPLLQKGFVRYACKVAGFEVIPVCEDSEVGFG